MFRCDKNDLSKILNNIRQNSGFFTINFFLFSYLLIYGSKLIINFGRSIDITDESFYILGTIYPEQVSISTTSFWYYTNILFELSGGSIHIFRILGAVLLFLISGYLGLTILSFIYKDTKKKISKHLKCNAFLTMGIASWGYYWYWLTTPSYNWLNLVSILSVLACLFKIFVKNDSKIWSFLIGVGGSVCFFAKPPSAVLLAMMFLLCIFVYLKPAQALRSIKVAALGVLVTFFIQIFIFVGGIDEYLDHLTAGLRAVQLIGGGHDLVWLFKSLLNGNIIEHSINYNLFTLNLVSGSFLYFYNRIYRKKYINVNHGAISVAFVFFIGLVSVYILHTVDFKYRSIGFTGYLFFNYLFSIFIGAVFSFREISFSKKLSIIFTALILFSANYSCSFGSNNKFISFGSNNSFVLSAASLLYIAFQLRNIFGLKNVPHIVSLFVMYHSYNAYMSGTLKPYRQHSSIPEQDIPHKFHLKDGRSFSLNVNKTIKTFLNQLEDEFNRNGFDISSDKIVELTGGSPIINLAMGGSFIGVPWLVGGYKGSLEYVSYILELESRRQNLAQVWFVTCAKCRRKIDLKLLSNINLNPLVATHSNVGSVYNPSYRAEMHIWKPKSKDF